MANKMELTEFEFPDEAGTKTPPEEKVNKAAADDSEFDLEIVDATAFADEIENELEVPGPILIRIEAAALGAVGAGKNVVVYYRRRFIGVEVEVVLTCPHTGLAFMSTTTPMPDVGVVLMTKWGTGPSLTPRYPLPTLPFPNSIPVLDSGPMS
jgi:hypothetical protein